MSKNRHIKDALHIIIALGFSRAQQNERSALCLLALLNLTPNKAWSRASNPLIGITPIMDWLNQHYQKKYAPNSSETMHQFVEAGIVRYNPDEPNRPVNSPKAVYQLDAVALDLLRSFNASSWHEKLSGYLSQQETLAAKYAKERKQNLVPVEIESGHGFSISPGKHSELIRAIIEQFGPRFAPGSTLLYAGDTGDKWSFFEKEKLSSLGIHIDAHGEMPDVILYDSKRNWLLLVEAVTSHGPVDGKRHAELSTLFAEANAGLVFVTAFPKRAFMGKYLAAIAWETEVWIAEAPSHLIHFNGDRFLGPHDTNE